MNHIKLALMCSLLTLSPLSRAASDLTFKGVTRHEISVNTPTSEASVAKQRWQKAIKQVIELNKQRKKTIALMNVSLSAKARNALKSKIEQPTFQATTSAPAFNTPRQLPPHIQLGMNGVPVLDQGMQGTCTTFAVTAALDAITHRGDYYSQLCLLNLGKHLARYGYSESGWEGLDIDALFARITEFGLVTKANQETQGCGGLTSYPAYEQDTSSAMSLEDYNAISMPAYYSGLSTTSNILNIKKWINKEISDKELLYQIKEALYLGNRVIIGTLLPIENGSPEPLNEFHVAKDTWLLSGELEQAIRLMLLEHDNARFGGHAMVITGYDDDAVVTDSQGIKHQGLFTLRNSWSEDAGDKGNYYMSYDYLTVLAISLTEVVNIRKN